MREFLIEIHRDFEFGSHEKSPLNQGVLYNEVLYSEGVMYSIAWQERQEILWCDDRMSLELIPPEF